MQKKKRLEGFLLENCGVMEDALQKAISYCITVLLFV